ncbi:hypothetical protein [Siccirubricoccus phaeus]|uniref:hypothetical protein n=1 Tax=Siccirubricoccus phaeus TaxID=2595053 RepID=UPI0011F25693|nr:hypothetical protein [Siccirubricoccus phaeus]
MGIRTIHFTQEQARDVVGVSAEKLRHWRKTIPYLRRKAGKSARFTFSDLVGLAVTLEIVDRLGVGIASIQKGVDELFELLGQTDLTRLRQLVAVVSPDSVRLCSATELPWSDPGEPMIAVPCRPLVDRVSGHVLPITPKPQSALPFPPQALRARSK